MRRVGVVLAAVAAYVLFDAAYGALGLGATPRQAEDRGHLLFREGCASCHGIDGTGTRNGPPLVGVGAAAVDFYLSTGRMPLAHPGAEAVRKPPAYGPADREAITRYVASLGTGPSIPTVDLAHADLQRGATLFQGNCAACHGYAGSGGALSHGTEAPSLAHADPTQVAEAIRVGPGTMPQFAPGALSDEDVDDVTRYVQYLHHPEDRGGLPLGHHGPLPEGFVAWFGGLTALLLACLWIGVRR